MNMADVCIKEEPKPSELESLLNLHQAKIDQLHNTISTLERRLEMVLRPDSPTGDGVSSESMPASSLLCSAIDERTDQIRAAQRRIENLIDRLTT